MCELLTRWVEKYPIVSVEDPLAEDDPEAFARFTRSAGKSLQIVGDDLLV
jgi:enolase